MTHYVVQAVQVVGNSMYPTLKNSDRYLLNRWIFYVRPPRAGDIVVVRDPADSGLSVKRVVGVAGDTVNFQHGSVFVNGKKLEESYLPSKVATYPEKAGIGRSVRCGKDQVFVLGDNRSNSVDSRAYGPVPRSKVLGLIIR